MAALLARSVTADSMHLYKLGDTGARAMAYEFEGRDFLLVLAGRQEPAWGGVLAHAVGAARGASWAVLCWSEEQADHELLHKIGDRGTVLDRTHLEAAVAGLSPLAALVRTALRRRKPHVPLAELLGVGAPAPQKPALTPLARLMSPLRAETKTWARATAEVLLVGRAQSGQPTGLACLPDEHVLITCPDGLLEVDPGSGQARWRLLLSGCHGGALVREDGAMLVMCGSALVRWHEGHLRVVAGAFEEGAVLLPGPDDEPWILSGYGATLGAGEGTLALTRAGETLDGQLRYPITFNAAVRSALWLDGRRFFLAAQGNSAVVDLARTTDAGQREDWIETSVHYPAHVLRAGIDSVLSASPDRSEGGVAVHRTDVLSRTSERLIHMRLAEVFGLAQTPDRGPAYLLTSLPSNDVENPAPVLVRITNHRPEDRPSTNEPALTPAVRRYDVVSRSARGDRDDYRLEPRPLAPPGGQGEVFPATHKPSSTVVAFKRRKGLFKQRGIRRMHREVEIARRLGANPHVMPVLDFDPGYEWFVMPKADDNVEDRRIELQEPGQLRAMVEAVAAGLADAHQHDWIHRDIKPGNILLLEGRWVVADWGIVRRPRGQTSTAGLLTTTGIGTEGFAAPEQFIDGHDVTPASDIYSLGQLIGWILTGTWPQTNRPLLPEPGPWYGVVRQATQLDPARRPQDMTAFLDLVDRETDAGSELPIVRAQRLLEAADKKKDIAAAAQLLTLAADQPGSYELYLDVITRMKVTTAKKALLDDPAQAAVVVQALTEHAAANDWPSREEADRAVWWLLDVARLAAREKQWALLDTAVQGMCDWDGRFDRWRPQDDIKDWMRELTGQAASIVASALRVQPDGAGHLHELADDRRVDQAIRSAVYRP
ncbi:serine/threonine-protein kinase [Streptomyces europaeiscabiei]|uniref:serine/threonine-protein kinase n=1 Tax=Streptomyces europaeiscabiei TaxID=146819 RepID=UPI0013C48FFD|nr:serine/threonine-protein kinase [Streptomyces europaeiscabiei]